MAKKFSIPPLVKYYVESIVYCNLTIKDESSL